MNDAMWQDNSSQSFPDWIEIVFNGSKTISEINVITRQDNYQNPVEPTLTQTFSLYGNTAFDVEYWNGSMWTAIPGEWRVTGNNKVWRQFTFTPITTTGIRVVVNNGSQSYSRIVEVEAWTSP